MTATVNPGHDPGYLTGQVATGGENYYLKAIHLQGEPAGTWSGAGAAELGLEGEVDPAVMTELYTYLTDPRALDEVQRVTAERFKDWRKAHPEARPGTDEYREAKARIRQEARDEQRLGSALRDYSQSTEKKVEQALAKLPASATPEQRRAAEMKVRQNAPRSRAYYDVTFSASKSVSLLHASFQVEAHKLREAGDEAGAKRAEEKAQLVWDAMSEGTRYGLDFLTREAGYVREGRSGHKDAEGKSLGRRTEARDWTIASFRQHLSRDEDPQMHIHNAILNRVKVTSVDPVTGKEREKWLALDGEGIYRNALAAGFLQERVTAEKLMHDLEVRFEWRPDGKAMEILGISPELRDHYSSRRHTVTKGVAELAKAYEESHGKAPGPHQLAKMAQFVTLDSRKGKEEAVSRDTLLQRWEEAAVREVHESLADVPQQTAAAREAIGVEPEPFQVERVIAAAVEQVQSERSTFHRGHLMAAIAKELPACLGGLEPHQVASLLGDLTDQAVQRGTTEGRLVALEAPALVPVPPELTREDGQSVYTRHAATLYATEQQLTREDKLREMASRRGGRVLPGELVERIIADKGLLESQARALREIATSGRRAEVLVGPAGTGKSYTMAALSEAWTQAGGEVMGLAVSSAAARVLEKEGVPNTANLATLLTYQKLIEAGVSNETVDRYRLRPGQLVIVDEASMADTGVLDKIRKLVDDAGAKLLLTGDHEQMSSVGAGGMFQALAEELPAGVHTLEEVKRFRAGWEKDASLRLRNGESAILSEYESHGRLRGGTREEMVEQLYKDWVADVMRGEDSVMIALTNDTAGMLAARAREELVRAGRVDDTTTVELERHQTAAGAGDRLQLRKIDHSLLSESGSRYATNRDVVLLEEVHDDGSVTVRYDDGDLMRLPADYVTDQVELAYAGTIESVQGRTVQRARPLVEEGWSRQGLYVALSRGTEENTAYIPTSEDQPDHLAAAAEILANDDTEKAASTMLRDQLAAVSRLDQRYPELEDLMVREANTRYGKVLFDAVGEDLYDRAVTEADGRAWNSVVRLARSAEAAGLDAEKLLTEAASSPRGFADVHSVSAVLHDRLADLKTAAERSAVRADEQMIRQAAREHEQSVVDSLGQFQLVEPAFQGDSIQDGTRAAVEAQWQTLQLQIAPVLGLDWNQGEAAVQAAQWAAVQFQFVDPMATAAREEAAREEAVRESAHLDQLMALQQAETLHAGYGDQVRAELADQRTAEAEERAGWGWRLRHLTGRVGEYARGLAHQILEPREHELGRQLADAADLPAWAKSLGPVPENQHGREEWIRRAGAVAGYREAHGYTSETDAIGPSPAPMAVDVHTDWERAWRALGEPDDRKALVGATTRQLQEWIDRYRLEEGWAPAYVADQLQRTWEARRDLLREASQARIEAGEIEARDPEQARELMRAAADQDDMVAALDVELNKLEVIHNVRNQWHEHTIETRERAQEAAAELEKRGVEPDGRAAASPPAGTVTDQVEFHGSELQPEVRGPEWNREGEREEHRPGPEFQGESRQWNEPEWQMVEPDPTEHELEPERQLQAPQRATEPQREPEQLARQQERDQAALQQQAEDQLRVAAEDSLGRDQDERRARQDRFVAQSRDDIRETEQARAAEPQALAGEELDSALHVANTAADILASRAQDAQPEAQQAAPEPPARQQEFGGREISR